jgi:23S rRNA pseudouridine1911/1915/1917 synthase
MVQPSEVTTDYSAWEDDADVVADGLPVAPAAAVIHLTAEPTAHGERLDKWLARALSEHSRGRLQGWIEAGAVRLNGKVATLRQAVWESDSIEVTPLEAPESLAFRAEPMALDIVHEDDTLLVINKPAGLVVHPANGNWSGTLLNGLLFHFPPAARLPRAGIVHRLDKDTSGLMVVAKTEAAQTDLVRQLQARTVKREYLAIVHGWPAESGVVDAPIGRHPRERTRMTVFKAEGPACKAAMTRYRVLACSDSGRAGGGLHALVVCRLETGRTHQIRVHMQAIGHALVGDPVYGPKAGSWPRFGRQALHARRLGLIHPGDGKSRTWTVAPPEDFLGLEELLDLHEPDGHG